MYRSLSVRGLFLLLVSAAVPQAFAVPITYTLTGYLQATSALGNVNAAFTMNILADTNAITNSGGVYLNPAITTTISINGVVSNYGLANITVGLNTNTGVVNIGGTAGGIGITSATVKTWNLATPIGPISAPNSLLKGTVTGTDGTVITLTGVAQPVGTPSPTFRAAFPVPTITSVANAASNIAFNSPVAAGGIFVLKGSFLGPPQISIDSAPFQHTSLSGTSVAVTVGTTTVNALLYYTSDGQVAALLPSNTPTGSAGNFTVTYNGQTSAPVGHGIAPSNVGIFTVDSSGGGPGIVTYADYSLVSANKAANCGGVNTTCGAANPGDTLILWATGLGPITGNDAKGDGLGVAMPNVPLTLWLGGVQAPVVYQGRSGCCIGEDQIVFTVPNNAPTGCAVPLVVQIGTNANTVSNSTLISIANGSRDCTFNNAAFASINLYQLITTGPIVIGDIDLEKDGATSGNGYQDEAYFEFLKASAKPGTEPFFGAYLDRLPLGTCIVYNSLNPGSSPPLVGFSMLDGGSSMTIKGPNGSLVLQGSSDDLATIDAAGKFLGPGAFTVSGAGGKDVGAFTATINIPALPTLTSPVNAANLAITRANGLTVTWKGGDPTGSVNLTVTSATDNTFTLGDTASCNVSASLGTFTIPPYVLLTLPTGNFGGLAFGSAESTVAFTATGINGGTLHTQSVGTFVPFAVK